MAHYPTNHLRAIWLVIQDPLGSWPEDIGTFWGFLGRFDLVTGWDWTGFLCRLMRSVNTGTPFGFMCLLGGPWFQLAWAASYPKFLIPVSLTVRYYYLVCTKRVIYAIFTLSLAYHLIRVSKSFSIFAIWKAIPVVTVVREPCTRLSLKLGCSGTLYFVLFPDLCWPCEHPELMVSADIGILLRMRDSLVWRATTFNLILFILFHVRPLKEFIDVVIVKLVASVKQGSIVLSRLLPASPPYLRSQGIQVTILRHPQLKKVINLPIEALQ
jgi:hypothetical protein